MKVILLQDVAKIGHKFDVKEVASGYATNFLIPRKMAEGATPAKLKHLEILREKQALEDKIQTELLAKNLGALKEISIEIKVKANKQGHLFQGLHIEDIVTELREQKRLDIPKDLILLEQPIKATGDFEIPVRLEDKKVTFKLSVVGE